LGPTTDGRIKPDVCALGSGVAINNALGVLGSGSGTSYAAPLITGMTACLWQAFPELNARELIQLIKDGSDKASNPDTLVGYGVPNAYRSWLSLKEVPVKKSIPEWYGYPNPANDRLYLANFTGSDHQITCRMYDVFGTKRMETSFSGQSHTVDVSVLPAGLYIVSFYMKGIRQISQKIMVRHP
jgi:hypothetical protein